MPRLAACSQISRIDCRKLSRSVSTGSSGNGNWGTAGWAAHSSVKLAPASAVRSTVSLAYCTARVLFSGSELARLRSSPAW